MNYIKMQNKSESLINLDSVHTISKDTYNLNGRSVAAIMINSDIPILYANTELRDADFFRIKNAVAAG